jgi:Raf kinase inhibitor-like YbhB/YbcL family protein
VGIVGTGRRALVAMLCCLVAAACGRGEDTDLGKASPAGVRVTSTAFGEGGVLPARFTCDGQGTSPPLAWSGGPKGARSWAVVVDDPDAPGGTFVHWVLLDIPPGTSSLAASAAPDGAAQALNSTRRAGYTPPCPPSGTHHYRFSVYALSAPTRLADGARLDDALAAIRSRAVAHGTLVGTYTRGRQ